MLIKIIAYALTALGVIGIIFSLFNLFVYNKIKGDQYEYLREDEKEMFHAKAKELRWTPIISLVLLVIGIALIRNN